MFGFMECKVNNPELAKTRYTTHAYVYAKRDDFKVGALIEVPSGMGGLFTTKVVKIESGVATCIKPYCRDHGKQEFEVFINPPLISVEEILSLANVIYEVERRQAIKSDEFELLERARVNGLIARFNSWSWTEAGVEVFRNAKELYQ